MIYIFCCGSGFLIEPCSFLCNPAISQLGQYFAGKRTSFLLPLNPTGTDFQKIARNELIKNYYGESVGYEDIAETIGKPKAMRAVDQANGRNPLPLVIPYHRVIDSMVNVQDFPLALPQKKALLDLEKSNTSQEKKTAFLKPIQPLK